MPIPSIICDPAGEPVLPHRFHQLGIVEGNIREVPQDDLLHLPDELLALLFVHGGADSSAIRSNSGFLYPLMFHPPGWSFSEWKKLPR